MHEQTKRREREREGEKEYERICKEKEGRHTEMEATARASESIHEPACSRVRAASTFTRRWTTRGGIQARGGQPLLLLLSSSTLLWSFNFSIFLFSLYLSLFSLFLSVFRRSDRWIASRRRKEILILSFSFSVFISYPLLSGSLFVTFATSQFFPQSPDLSNLESLWIFSYRKKTLSVSSFLELQFLGFFFFFFVITSWYIFLDLWMFFRRRGGFFFSPFYTSPLFFDPCSFVDIVPSLFQFSHLPIFAFFIIVRRSLFLYFQPFVNRQPFRSLDPRRQKISKICKVKCLL